MPGYEVKFTHQLQKRHMCSICLFAMRNPVQTECGHLFCRDCLEPFLERQCQICPLNSCKEEITREGTFPDNACRKEIVKLQVNCNYQSCSWVGTLNGLEDHLAICGYYEEQYRPTTYPHCTKDVPIQQQQGSEERLESARNSQRSSSLLVPANSEEGAPEIHELILIRHQIPEAYLQYNQHRLLLHVPQHGQSHGQETQEGFAERTEIVIASPSLADLLSLPGLLVLPVVPTCELDRMRGEHAMAVTQLGQQQRRTERQYGNIVVVWRITEVARLGRATNIGLQSTTFCTAGYEAYLWLHVHRDDIGRRVYLSLFLAVLMRRESELPPAPPFRQRADVQLIGQQLISKFFHHPPTTFSDGQTQAVIPNAPSGACIVTLLEKNCVPSNMIFLLRVTL